MRQGLETTQVTGVEIGTRKKKLSHVTIYSDHESVAHLRLDDGAGEIKSPLQTLHHTCERRETPLE